MTAEFKDKAGRRFTISEVALRQLDEIGATIEEQLEMEDDEELGLEDDDEGMDDDE